MDQKDEWGWERSNLEYEFQHIMDVITHDLLKNGDGIPPGRHNADVEDERIDISIMHKEAWKKKVVRLHFLLTEKESAVNVPMNLEACRRMAFFANSLYMKLPNAPKVHSMISFGVLTPYYNEEVLYLMEDLNEENEDRITILFYHQKIYPDEWDNFKERMCG